MWRTEINPELIVKYNRPVPRYTSYPTVPFWNKAMSPDRWKELFISRFHEQNHTNGMSIYIHLPFCESLCTYCGCNKKITTNHSVEEQYLLAIEKEWKLYRKLMRQTAVIRELHLGGGTPTFFSPMNLQRLVQTILKDSIVHPQHEFSVEGHPNNTTPKHLKVLNALGFKRMSYGVQDNDPEVQRVINRIQPFEKVKEAIDNARAAGFTSVNFDLIYGLPFQTIQTMEKTIGDVVTLKPDRIAFYSYAHVPWTSRGQRLFDESNLPDAEQKIQLYVKGKEILLAAGYVDIGMDHFALPDDELYKAVKEGRLHRNFMGYTTQNSGLLLGLGVSSISDVGNAFAQNNKSLHDYYAAVNSGELAIQRGYELTAEDLSFRKYILDISCRGITYLNQEDRPLLEQYVFPVLRELADDGLVNYNQETVVVNDKGRFFLRNICSAFDIKMHRGNDEALPVFSKAI
jgi:oxygen-independent coproporphyrinogen III oxidase